MEERTLWSQEDLAEKKVPIWVSRNVWKRFLSLTIMQRITVSLHYEEGLTREDIYLSDFEIVQRGEHFLVLKPKGAK